MQTELNVQPLFAIRLDLDLRQLARITDPRKRDVEVASFDRGRVIDVVDSARKHVAWQRAGNGIGQRLERPIAQADVNGLRDFDGRDKGLVLIGLGQTALSWFRAKHEFRRNLRFGVQHPLIQVIVVVDDFPHIVFDVGNLVVTRAATGRLQGVHDFARFIGKNRHILGTVERPHGQIF